MHFTLRKPRAVLLSLSLLPLAYAHTNLGYPEPYNPIDCNPPECMGPIPAEWSSGPAKARNSAENPAATWRRGDKVTIKWHRNNHGGGFIRFSLVPVSKKLDWYWHKYTAFQYGCFESGQYQCNGPAECGTDAEGLGYKQEVEIPHVFPDGNYLFVMVWYGGVKYTRAEAKYSDYFSASYVRIEGGDEVQDWFMPQFVPMDSPFEEVPSGKCATTSSWVGECGGEPCHENEVMMTIPGNFRDRFSPDAIDSDEVRNCL